MKSNKFIFVVKKEDLKCTIDEFLDTNNLVERYMYVEHTNTDKSNHYHVYIEFGSAIDSSVVAKVLNIRECDIEFSHLKLFDTYKYFKRPERCQCCSNYFTEDCLHIDNYYNVVANFNVKEEIKRYLESCNLR